MTLWQSRQRRRRHSTGASAPLLSSDACLPHDDCLNHASAPLFALRETGGWQSAEMVRRYAHLAAEHLAPYA
jgi:hypothetical protein